MAKFKFPIHLPDNIREKFPKFKKNGGKKNWKKLTRKQKGIRIGAGIAVILVSFSPQIPIMIDEISKNRFPMQNQSYHSCSDLHLAALQHQSNQPDTLLLCALLIFLYFHDAQMHMRLLFSFVFLSEKVKRIFQVRFATCS